MCGFSEYNRAVKLPKPIHRWKISPIRAVALQRKLAPRVLQLPLRGRVRYIAGADCAFILNDSRIIACWVVWDLRTQNMIETVRDVRPVAFPYVPGLLSFREAPALLAAARRLRSEPDVFMLDGQGLAHPRRLGLACHVGLLLDRPTLGCAKSILCGRHKPPEDRRGAMEKLVARNEVVGMAVRTRPGVKPLYISIGHRIRLGDAVRVTLSCCTRYRLPEPTRLAHQEVTRLRLSLG